MQDRSAPRTIPDSDRYFQVDLGGQVGTTTFRFPSYGVGARLLDRLSSVSGSGGAEALAGLMDVVGYTIGLCWWDKNRDLHSGSAPTLDGEQWRNYGDMVVDELQDYGVSLSGLVAASRAVNTRIAAAMEELAEAQSEGNGSPEEPGSSQ